MRDVTADEIAAAPLPAGPISEAWLAYLASWEAGRRPQALAEVNRFVELLTGAGPEPSASFARWVCSVLFDRSDFWAGQWGGGLTSRRGRPERPAEFALTVHPITAWILLPYLTTGLPSGDGRHLRWTYQFAVGQGYRLPPRQRHQLRAAIDARCGTDAAPIDLLRYASDDAAAVRMLRNAEVD
ncbi:hypothetical protein [Micromonospora sp. NPDC005113]